MSGRKSFKNLSDKLRSTPEGREAVEREEHIVRDLLRLDGMREARGVDRAELDRAWDASRTEVSPVEQEYEGDYVPSSGGGS